MNLNELKSHTRRKPPKRVGRGGKRGTFSGGGTKGQKSRAGSAVKPGFRGGDNRLWQLFPKQRGATKKPGSNRPHMKHRFFQLRRKGLAAVNLNLLNNFNDGQVLNPELLKKAGLIDRDTEGVKILGDGELKKKLEFEGFTYSKSAMDKITKSGGIIR